MVIIMFPCAAVLESFDHLGCSRVSGYPRSTSKTKTPGGGNVYQLSMRMPAHTQSTGKYTKMALRGKEAGESP